ncbi:D-alanyl-D-alanine carboxypeptidase [Mesorhizobium sp. CO1-1-7]|uniref:serine-type D-Ala-D-Ala carboxypeptidase n=1 Tax=Mesorhizobium australicum (strain HAMBI 3006 / LMG 24608 / WSM2073) TaxID=754035 RepID=L0KM26_MESAW|nr:MULTISPECIES: D-alanyl-D-alanine carboxypeptidase family protein [Mesorhizobium]MBZ9931898.1 D-alanyl-D-alanine carboxypeptidase [Mesorhizobium sp. BR1-1-5]AGB46487.1 D-alanyl-D-alanine carboxypeptidase [Mesorhizobium australicum WSM2073]MBZ9747122.1 D-alanyl-D-alanine carboxypeptidase [Mesorhizobium sp. CO1-1-7]MBZ9758418.1 D-alanyl-D-alanine carboxypeptidase [Mesorhizobium sp. ESP6-5]MBZ9904460.1 D-alanyl-D-alanine carboxypeptidase [Mesorhizobium sp. BR115XR7A]
MQFRLLQPFAVFFLLSLLLTLSPAQAQLFETKAAQAFMIDADTGTVLFSKDADKPIPPASMAKLMTMEVVFNALKSGRLKLDDTFVVSENAWRKGGAPSGTSTMFAKLKSAIRLEDLIQGVTVQAANDGCIVIAEGMAGSEDNFAGEMTERARQIGLKTSTFVNSTGLPADGQQTNVRELAQLALHLWREYPDFYRYYGLKDFTWNKISQRNRNPLLAMDIGADGLAVGASETSGFGIVASASHNGTRVIAAMSGLANDKERAEEARKLLDWGVRSFEKTEIFAKDEVVGEAQVFGGMKSGVTLKAKGPIDIFLPITNRDKLTARIIYTGPVAAPVEEGQPVGALRVWIGDTLSQETPLFAAESISVGTLPQRALDAVKELAIGWLR